MDNYHVEYELPNLGTLKAMDYIYDHDKHSFMKTEAINVFIYPNIDRDGRDDKYFLGIIGKVPADKSDEDLSGWTFYPINQVTKQDGIGIINNLDLETLKKEIDKELRDAGILALGGGKKYYHEPVAKTVVSKTKSKAKKSRRKKLICTNTFIDGSSCTNPVAKRFIDKNEAFHLCDTCAEELGMS